MIVLDTSVLLAFLWEPDPAHRTTRAFIENEPGPFIVSPYVVAELDYLLLKKGGVATELVAIDALSSGAYELPVMGAGDLISCFRVLSSYREHAIGEHDQ